MKHSSPITYFRSILFFAMASLLLASCSGIRYSYFNKQKVPYTAEETRFAKAIPTKPVPTGQENMLKEKPSATPGPGGSERNASENTGKKKSFTLPSPKQVVKDVDIAQYIPKQKQSIQSENKTNDDQRTLMIVLLVVLILIVISLLGDELIWLLFLALLILLIYFLVKYLGIFN